MDLNIKDRILIPQLFSNTGTYAEYHLKRSILEKIKITEQDTEYYGIKENPEEHRVTWDSQKDYEVPLVVDFTSEEIKFLQTACEQQGDATRPDDFWETIEKIYEQINTTNS